MLKRTRLCAGLYTISKVNDSSFNFEIFQYTEGPWRGWWMWRNVNNDFEYGDPCWSLRDAWNQIQASYGDPPQ